MKNLLLIFSLLLVVSACEKVVEPIEPVVVDCSNGAIDFVNTIKPILNSSCATSGCHNAASAKEGIVLDSYANIIKIVKKGNASGSKLYKVLNDNGDDLMPPTNSGFVFSQIQKNLIKDWINQGAKNIECNNNSSCDSTNFKYTSNVKPLLDVSCVSCHSASSTNGVKLVSYSDVKTYVDNGKLLASIKHDAGTSAMPQGQAKWDDCKIVIVSKWITAGALNN